MGVQGSYGLAGSGVGGMVGVGAGCKVLGVLWGDRDCGRGVSTVALRLLAGATRRVETSFI